MRIYFRSGIKLIILVTVICMLYTAPLCAASKKKSPSVQSAAKNYENETADDKKTAIAIEVPKRTRRTFFFRIAPDAMAAAENASPASIRSAVSLLR